MSLAILVDGILRSDHDDRLAEAHLRQTKMPGDKVELIFNVDLTID